MERVLEMKVDVFHRETIKPSSPTPNHLQTLNLSLIDQEVPAVYTSIVLFYPIDGADSYKDDQQHAAAVAVAERTRNLKKSLSETLTHFYPLAGRIKGNLHVECNDEGAEFLEARINCSILKILENPDFEMLRKLVPTSIGNEDAGIGPPVLVQATLFECGGMAIGLSMSHKLADATSLKTFLNSWAAIALGSTNVILPQYGAASLIPPVNLSNNSSSKPPPSMHFGPVKSIARRYVFDATNVAVLQSKAASEIVKNPSRVEAVSAFIWKCAREAASKSKEANSLRPCVFSQVLNLRPRTVPSLPENLCGNLLGYFVAMAKDESEMDLQPLVCNLRKGIEEAKAYYCKGLNGEEILQSIRLYMNIVGGGEVDSYNCSSWCRFPFYNSDFGCGKPIWVSAVPVVGFGNIIMMMDAKDGKGIEAWLTLEEEEMVLLESNQEFLAFASFNPSVII